MAETVLTDEQLLKCVRATCNGDTLRLTRDVGPYEVTKPTHPFRLLADAISAETAAVLAAVAVQPAPSLGACPSGTGLSAAAVPASASIPGAAWIGRRVQACDGGKCEGATVVSEPQRGATGWEVLVLLDSRPDYLTALGINYLYLKEPANAF